MRPVLDVNEMRTASHMPSQVGRRLFFAAAAAAAAEGYVVEIFDVLGAFMRALNDPRFRITMRQPPRSNGKLSASGKVCVPRRAVPGHPAANAQWDTLRYFWLGNRG